MFQEPREGSMTRFVKSDGMLFLGSHDSGLLFQTADDTIYCIQEILFANCTLFVTGSNQGSFVTYIGNVCTAESWCLSSQCF